MCRWSVATRGPVSVPTTMTVIALCLTLHQQLTMSSRKASTIITLTLHILIVSDIHQMLKNNVQLYYVVYYYPDVCTRNGLRTPWHTVWCANEGRIHDGVHGDAG